LRDDRRAEIDFQHRRAQRAPVASARKKALFCRQRRRTENRAAPALLA